MQTVGVRELKNRLSEFIRRVRAGEGLLVTDRGEVVAALTPPGQRADASLPPGLLGLARPGLLTIGAPGDSSLYPALPRARSSPRRAARLLDDERGSR